MIEVSIQSDLKDVKKKLSKTNLDMGQIAMANQMLADIDDFVPYREGSLSSRVFASMDGTELIYDSDYASRMYHGSEDWNWTKEFHPLAGPKWDEAAKGIYMEDWKKVYVEGAKLNN